MLYVLIKGKRGSNSADACNVRSNKDSGERQPNPTHIQSHPDAAIKWSNGRKAAGNELSYLFLSAALLYFQNSVK